MIFTIILLITIYILNVIDYLETLHLIQHFGTAVEGNLIMRYVFENDYALVAKLIVPAILLFVCGIIIKKDKACICAPCVAFAFYLYLVIHNFALIVQAGLF